MANVTMERSAPPTVLGTSIGRKLLMAGSGVILLGFVIFHMLGNLKIYLGGQELDTYADGLRTLGRPIFPRTYLLWGVRGILIAAFVVHVVTAVVLARRSRAARVTRYAHPGRVQADPASTSMRWGGVAILLFVFFHLAQYTWGWIHPNYTFIRGAVYHNLVAGFSIWWIDGIYILAMVALALHIYHGAWSIFQTFGVNNRRWDKRVRVGATAVAVIVLIGNCSIPIAVFAGGIK